MSGTAPAPIGLTGGGSKTTLTCELLTPIELAQVVKYMRDDNYWMQDKRDGHRRMVRKASDGLIVGVNRRGLTVPLPARLYAELDTVALETFVIDGEIEGDRLVVFDLLEADGDLSSIPYAARFDRLLQELSHARVAPESLQYVMPVPTWRTRAEKETGLQHLYDTKAEGVVFKRRDAPYAAGRSGSHLKFKFTATCSARVRKLNQKRSVGLELLDESGNWIAIGNVSVSVRHDKPSVGSLVEVRYLYATSGQHLYQPVYLGIRDDIREQDCAVSQLKFKKDQGEA